jgi:di/tripeptidase
MVARVQAVCSKFSGVGCPEISGSTDCNSASSAGIPSVCLGVYMGGGAHTRDEWISENSILPGLKIAAELILDHFNT